LALLIVGPNSHNRRTESIPDWKLKGWRAKGRGLGGPYITKYGSFWGLCEPISNNNFKFYIFQPPACLQLHKKWPCFAPIGRGWYYSNITEQVRRIDDGIHSIENILTEAFEIERRQRR